MCDSNPRMFRFLLITIVCSISSVALSQGSVSDTLDAYVMGDDTLIIKTLPEVSVMPRPRTEFKNRRQRRLYGRVVYDVKKTLPLAKAAGKMLSEVSDTLLAIESKRDQQIFLKEMEKELLVEYEPVLRRMSRRQGRVMLKLIDRECQMTSYEVVKIYRGSFSAFFWQGVAHIFGSDLKSSYDPYGEDELMEEVVLLVEAGIL